MPHKNSGLESIAPSNEPSDLDNLDGLAAQVDADTSGTLPDGTLLADQPEATNYLMEAGATVDTFAALIGGYCPPAGELWTHDKKTAVAASLAPVMEKYSFTLGKMPVELVLIITAGPLLYQSSKIIAAQMVDEKTAKLKAKKQASAQDATVKGDMPADSPEVLRHPQTALYPT